MPAFGPISRCELIQALRSAGFSGPFSGGRHEFMVRDDIRLRIPNPHRSDISRDLLSRMLRQAGISRAEWEEI